MRVVIGQESVRAKRIVCEWVCGAILWFWSIIFQWSVFDLPNYSQVLGFTAPSRIDPWIKFNTLSTHRRSKFELLYYLDMNARFISWTMSFLGTQFCQIKGPNIRITILFQMVETKRVTRFGTSFHLIDRMRFWKQKYK